MWQRIVWDTRVRTEGEGEGKSICQCIIDGRGSRGKDPATEYYDNGLTIAYIVGLVSFVQENAMLLMLQL